MPHIAPAPPPLPPRPARGTLKLPGVRQVELTAPLTWLALGWRDVWRIGLPSLMHVVVLAAFGALLVFIARDRFWLLAGAFSRWQYSRCAVHGGYWSLVRFGLLLSLAGTGWVLTSAALITALAPAPVNTPMDFARHVVLAPGGYLFELWLTMGALMAAPLFASSVVSMPLLLDRRVDVLQAVLTSWQTVLTNPGALALWAALIMALTGLGMLTALLGLIVVVPWLGHASWHAYRALVDASSLPERLPPEGPR